LFVNSHLAAVPSHHVAADDADARNAAESLLLLNGNHPGAESASSKSRKRAAAPSRFARDSMTLSAAQKSPLIYHEPVLTTDEVLSDPEDEAPEPAKRRRRVRGESESLRIQAARLRARVAHMRSQKENIAASTDESRSARNTDQSQARFRISPLYRNPAVRDAIPTSFEEGRSSRETLAGFNQAMSSKFAHQIGLPR
jgi:hypothetical protein